MTPSPTRATTTARRALLAAAAAVLLVTVAVPGIAQGFPTRLQTSSFDGSDTDAGRFAGLARIAVHQGSGTVYAIAHQDGSVDRFDASGAAQDFAALGSSSLDSLAVPVSDRPAYFTLSDEGDVAVDNSGTASDGNLIVLSELQKTAWIFDSTGAYLRRITGFGDPCGAAVDSEGHVWISDYAASAVIEHTATGAATGNRVDTSGQGNPCHIAFDSADNLYVALYNGALHKYDAAGAHVAEIDADSTRSVAVDPATNHVFAVHPGQVSEYDSSGAPVSTFGQLDLAGPLGVAVGATGAVYVADSSDARVHVFGSSVVSLPTVATGSASAVARTTATLEGTVNPDGDAVTDCHFEYVDNTGYESNGYTGATNVPCATDPGSGTAEVAVTADITGLATEVRYHFRLVAANATGSNRGDDQVFQTNAAVKDLAAGQATDISRSGATLNGSLDPDGEQVTDCTFKYVSSTEYNVSGFTNADTAACVPDPGSGSGSVAVSADVSGLSPVTGYYFRLLASNATGTSFTSLQSFITEPAVKDLVTGQATDVAVATATLNGSLDPDGVAVTDCHFDYVDDAAFQDNGFATAATAACTPDPGSGSGPVDVSAAVSDLSSGRTYHFRLVVSNATGTTLGSGQTFGTAGPAIRSQAASAVDLSSATLSAEINPNNEATTYRFEYGTDTNYGQATAESASIGSDAAFQSVSAALAGLQPGTRYHWRTVATNASATTNGRDKTFTTSSPPSGSDDTCANRRYRTGPGAQLPDCRAYEMVSPVDKGGAHIKSPCDIDCRRAELVKSTPSGDKLTYSSATSFGDQISAPFSSQYIASRGAGGWVSHGINAPRDATNHSGFDLRLDLNKQFFSFTDDLDTAWLNNNNNKPLTPAAIVGENIENAYKRNNLTGSYEAIKSAAGGAASLSGASGDGRHTLVQSTVGSYPTYSGIRLDDNVDGQSRPVGVRPDGSLADFAILGSAFGTNVGSGVDLDSGNRVAEHAISYDGSRIFWSDGPTYSDLGNLYVRIDGERTVSIASPGNFASASSDGTKVLYDTATSSSSHTSGAADGSLYLFDVNNGTQRMVADERVGVLGTSDDLSHVYFVSRAVLAPGSVAGDWNAYLDHDGAVSFIAALSSQDVSEVDYQATNVSRAPNKHIAHVTPDGRHLVFESSRSLTGYDNTDAMTGNPDVEIFVYGADANGLTCLSCNPSGARPVGKPRPVPYSALSHAYHYGAAAWLSTSQTSLYTPRAVSDDGTRVFFNSFDALVGRDTNGAQDVYEWRAEGSGGCERADGCVSLISSGQSAQKSEFVEADSNGDNVFFETQSSLVPQDTGLIDIYVARVGGGFDSPPAASAGCQGDACETPGGEPERKPAVTGSGSSAGNSVPAVPGSFKMSSLSAAQRGALAAGRTVALTVTVNRAGRLKLRGSAQLAGKRATVLSASANAKRAGKVKVKLKLSTMARRRLTETGRLVVSLSLTFSEASRPATSTLRLKTSKTASTKGGQSR